MNSAFVKFEIPVPGYFYQYAMLNLRRGPNPVIDVVRISDSLKHVS